jgi:hypothetical protein
MKVTNKKIFFAPLVFSILLSGCSSLSNPEGENFTDFSHAKHAEKGVVIGARKTHGAQQTLASHDDFMTSDIIEEGHESIPQSGVEYLVKTDNGSLISVTQGSSPAFMRGQHVKIEYGTHPHIVGD